VYEFVFRIATVSAGITNVYVHWVPLANRNPPEPVSPQATGVRCVTIRWQMREIGNLNK
jgi:hypothetical protein